jgi:type IV pilus assembly protein PilO
MAFTDVLANAPRPQKIAVGIVGLVIVAALGYFMVSPKSAERDVLRQRNVVLQAEVAKARVEEAGLRTFRAQADALRKRLELAKGRLPSEREIPGLYRQVSDLALQAGLAVALFAPKAPEDKDTVTEIPIAVSAEGTYHLLEPDLSTRPRIKS